MPTASITISTAGPGTAPEEIEAALRRPGDPAGHGPDVVAVTETTDGNTRWELTFRGTPLRWTQHDTATPGGGEFVQVEGDFAALSGSWSVDGAAVRFAFTFRTSVAHLAGAVDPMVARVLLRSALARVAGACGGEVAVLEGAEQLRDRLPTHA